MDYEFKFTGDKFVVTEEMKNKFSEHGNILIRNLLSKEEVDHVMGSLESEEYQELCYGVDDGEGKKAHMTIWNQPGDDVTGMVGRCEKVVGTCEGLMGGELYHYHSKLMGQPPKVGDRHMWHQDYGLFLVPIDAAGFNITDPEVNSRLTWTELTTSGDFCHCITQNWNRFKPERGQKMGVAVLLQQGRQQPRDRTPSSPVYATKQGKG